MTARNGQTSGSASQASTATGAKATMPDEERDGRGRLDVRRPRDEEVPERVQESRAECEGKCRGGHLRLQSNQATVIGARSSGHGQHAVDPDPGPSRSWPRAASTSW